jgi:hypothetical protein
MTDIQKETLTKIQALHDIIEKHPYLSGMMSDRFHGFLDDIVKRAHHLDEIDSSEWRKQPDEDMVEQFL